MSLPPENSLPTNPKIRHHIRGALSCFEHPAEWVVRDATLAQVSLESWKQGSRIKTTQGLICVCLNVGTDPPGVVKRQHSRQLECWVDPVEEQSLQMMKGAEIIGKLLVQQYRAIHKSAAYKSIFDPAFEDLMQNLQNARKRAKDSRVLFHYNGHGCPKVTPYGELWVFDRPHLQYVPVSLAEVSAAIGSPTIYVFDVANSGMLLRTWHRMGFAETRPNDLIICGPIADSVPRAVSPSMPADLVASCLTTPLRTTMEWLFDCPQRTRLLPHVTRDMCGKCPGSVHDRHSPLGELYLVFIAVSDCVAWTTLRRPVFLRLFKQDALVVALFRAYFLLHRIAAADGQRTASTPDVVIAPGPQLSGGSDESADTSFDSVLDSGKAVIRPQALAEANPTANHPLWSLWDDCALRVLAQLPDLLSGRRQRHRPLQFFGEILTMLEHSMDSLPPDVPAPELPVVIHGIITQQYRVRSLRLMCRYAARSMSAVDDLLACNAIIYVMRLLLQSTDELGLALATVWARVFVVDRGQATLDELVRYEAVKPLISLLRPPSQFPAVARRPLPVQSIESAQCFVGVLVVLLCRSPHRCVAAWNADAMQAIATLLDALSQPPAFDTFVDDTLPRTFLPRKKMTAPAAAPSDVTVTPEGIKFTTPADMEASTLHHMVHCARSEDAAWALLACGELLSGNDTGKFYALTHSLVPGTAEKSTNQSNTASSALSASGRNVVALITPWVKHYSPVVRAAALFAAARTVGTIYLSQSEASSQNCDDFIAPPTPAGDEPHVLKERVSVQIASDFSVLLLILEACEDYSPMVRTEAAASLGIFLRYYASALRPASVTALKNVIFSGTASSRGVVTPAAPKTMSRLAAGEATIITSVIADNEMYIGKDKDGAVSPSDSNSEKSSSSPAPATHTISPLPQLGTPVAYSRRRQPGHASASFDLTELGGNVSTSLHSLGATPSDSLPQNVSQDRCPAIARDALTGISALITDVHPVVAATALRIGLLVLKTSEKRNTSSDKAANKSAALQVAPSLNVSISYFQTSLYDNMVAHLLAPPGEVYVRDMMRVAHTRDALVHLQSSLLESVLSVQGSTVAMSNDPTANLATLGMLASTPADSKSGASGSTWTASPYPYSPYPTENIVHSSSINSISALESSSTLTPAHHSHNHECVADLKWPLCGPAQESVVSAPPPVPSVPSVIPICTQLQVILPHMWTLLSNGRLAVTDFSTRCLLSVLALPASGDSLASLPLEPASVPVLPSMHLTAPDWLERMIRRSPAAIKQPFSLQTTPRSPTSSPPPDKATIRAGCFFNPTTFVIVGDLAHEFPGAVVMSAVKQGARTSYFASAGASQQASRRPTSVCAIHGISFASSGRHARLAFAFDVPFEGSLKHAPGSYPVTLAWSGMNHTAIISPAANSIKFVNLVTLSTRQELKFGADLLVTALAQDEFTARTFDDYACQQTVAHSLTHRFVSAPDNLAWMRNISSSFGNVPSKNEPDTTSNLLYLAMSDCSIRLYDTRTHPQQLALVSTRASDLSSPIVSLSARAHTLLAMCNDGKVALLDTRRRGVVSSCNVPLSQDGGSARGLPRGASLVSGTAHPNVPVAAAIVKLQNGHTVGSMFHPRTGSVITTFDAYSEALSSHRYEISRFRESQTHDDCVFVIHSTELPQ